MKAGDWLADCENNQFWFVKTFFLEYYIHVLKHLSEKNFENKRQSMEQSKFSDTQILIPFWCTLYIFDQLVLCSSVFMS